MMKYTEEALFALMDSRKQVRVTSTSGQVYVGQCWAYSKEANEDTSGVADASLDIGPSSTIYLGDIKEIEFLDGSSVEDCVADYMEKLKEIRAQRAAGQDTKEG